MIKIKDMVLDTTLYKGEDKDSATRALIEGYAHSSDVCFGEYIESIQIKASLPTVLNIFSVAAYKIEGDILAQCNPDDDDVCIFEGLQEKELDMNISRFVDIISGDRIES